MSDHGSTPPPPPPPPPSYDAGPQGTPPPNYLVWAILSTILCGLSTLLSLPLGITSIVYATQVNSKWAIGDVAGAQAASSKAKKFAIWTAVVGVILNVIGVLVLLPLMRNGAGS